MDKLTFITAAYDDLYYLQSVDPLLADCVRGQPLIPHLHPRDTILNVRAVTLRIKGQSTDYGVPAIFADPLAALSFHNVVRTTLKKMEPPVP